MKAKAITAVMLTVFLVGIFISTLSIQLVKAETVVVMFDEAHLPVYSVGTNPVADGGTVGAYSEFAKILEGAGFTVKTLDPGGTLSSTSLKDVCILIITAGDLPYSSSELSAIDNFVKGGKGLLLIGENSIITAEVEPIANLFGASFDGLYEVDSIADPTDHEGLDVWIILDQITAHPATSGVTKVKVYAASTVSSPGTPLITTDDDAYWWHSHKPVPFQPVLAVMTHGFGGVAIIGDATLWHNFYHKPYDNDILALSIIQWLSRPSLYIGSDYTFSGDINVPIVVTADNIVIDGNGYTLQGPGTGYGFYLEGRKHVTIKNVKVKGWERGIYTQLSSDIKISGNIITNNWAGIFFFFSNSNIISGNTITDNTHGISAGGTLGVPAKGSKYVISGNSITSNSRWGILLDE